MNVILTLSVCLLGLVLGYHLSLERKRRLLPPGPPGQFLLGHTFLISKIKPWVALKEYQSTIYTLFVAGKPLVVINSLSIADELFNKRSETFSYRQSRCMARLGKLDRGLVFANPDDSGDIFRQTRRHLQGILNPTSVRSYHLLEEYYARTFAANLLYDGSSATIRTGIRRLVSSTLLSFTLDYNPKRSDDPIVILSEKLSSHASDILTPGKFWIEFFPWAQNMPLWMLGPHVSSNIRTMRSNVDTLFQVSDKHVDKTLDTSDCLAARLIRSLQAEGELTEESRDIVRYACLSAYTTVDTLLHPIEAFFLLMVQNPVVQKKAQVEIRHVVGTGRLPVHDDRPNLPFVETVMTEVLRCCPAVPLASRALRSKEQYGAFELPKGSLVMANVWAMLHDHERFEDPDIFKPARYTPDEEGAELTRFVYAAAFGFGRRTCPGRNFATASMWIIIATVLAAFDILPDGDKIDSGEGVDVPSLQYETGALPRLSSFKCRVQPRDTMSNDLLKKMVPRSSPNLRCNSHDM